MNSIIDDQYKKMLIDNPILRFYILTLTLNYNLLVKRNFDSIEQVSDNVEAI